MKINRRYAFLSFVFFILTGLTVHQTYKYLYDSDGSSAGNSSVVSDTSRARIWFEEGRKLTERSQYDSSLSYLQNAGELFKKDIQWESYVDCMNYLGDNYRRIGNYDTAYAMLTANIGLAIKQLGEMHASTAMAINKLGLWYFDKAEYENATDCFERALSTRLKVLPEDHIDIGWSYNNMGLVQRDNGNFDAALRSYQKVIPIFIKNLGEKSGPLALLYSNIANVYQVKDRQEKAFEFHNLALDMRIQLFGKDHITTAQSYANIANVYIRKGDYDKAFKFLNRALSIRIHNLGEFHTDIGHSYYNLGFTYREAGQSREALHYYKRALLIWEKNFGSQHPLVARVCDEIGVQLLSQTNFDSALYYFNRALLIWTGKPGTKGFRRAYEFSHIGTTHLKKGNFDEALRFYEQALSVNKEYYGEKHLEVSQSYSDIAEAYRNIRKYEQALRYVNLAINALVLNESKNDSEIIAVNAVQLLLALDMKGDILHEIYYQKMMKGNDLRLSFSAYESAITWLDKIRREYSSEDSKLLLGQKMNRIFEKGIRTAYDLFILTRDSSYAEKAFLFSEKSKVAILTETIMDAQAKINSGIPDSLLDYENQLRARIGFYNKKLFTEQNSGGYGSKKYRTIQDKIFELSTEYDEHLDFIERTFPQYYELKYRSTVLSLKEAQKCIPDSVVLLEYSLGNEQPFVFCMDNKGFKWIALDADSTILNQISIMRRGIETQDFKSYTESAYYLYNCLMSPIEISKAAHLIIIPDGPMANLPFEALLTKPAGDHGDYSNLAYLIKNFKISYAYSSTLLYQNQNLQKNLQNNLIGFSPSIFK